MLTELHVRDLALIEEAELALGPGLNALSGETGAGKSLLVGALELLLGERPKGGPASWIRRGAERARVEARFVVEEEALGLALREFLARELPGVAEAVEEAALAGEDLELILGRTLEASGRTRAHVNQRPVTLRGMAQLAGMLFEIHGQNTHQRLLDESVQRELLDVFAGLEGKATKYATLRDRWRSVARQIEDLETDRDSHEAQLELLRHSVEELSEATIESGEEQRLGEERLRLRHAEELSRELSRWIHTLSDADDSILDRTRTVERGAMVWAGRIGELKGACGELLEARLRLEEASSALLRFADGVEVDPERLEEVEARLVTIERLASKHRVPADGLGPLLEELSTRLEQSTAEREGFDGLLAERERLEGQLEKASKALVRARRKAAGPLAEALVPNLVRLGLGQARFEVAFVERDERFPVGGPEAVEFRLAANPGEPAGPLGQVASGGEAARIMLALRSALAGCDAGRMLVFDEIDSGVGGRLAPEVARHLRSLGEHHQVLSVTHLPAIAAAAHRHLQVRKRVVGGRTWTGVCRLEGDARIHEVADMIAGGGSERTARAEARRLLGLGGPAASPARRTRVSRSA